MHTMLEVAPRPARGAGRTSRTPRQMGVTQLRRLAAVFGLCGASCGVILAFGGYYPKALLALAIARILLGLFGFIAAICAVFAAYRDPPRGVY